MRPLPEEHRRFLQGAWGAFGRQVMAAGAAPGAGAGPSVQPSLPGREGCGCWPPLSVGMLGCASSGREAQSQVTKVYPLEGWVFDGTKCQVRADCRHGDDALCADLPTEVEWLSLDLATITHQQCVKLTGSSSAAPVRVLWSFEFDNATTHRRVGNPYCFISQLTCIASKGAPERDYPVSIRAPGSLVDVDIERTRLQRYMERERCVELPSIAGAGASGGGCIGEAELAGVDLLGSACAGEQAPALDFGGCCLRPPTAQNFPDVMNPPEDVRRILLESISTTNRYLLPTCAAFDAAVGMEGADAERQPLIRAAVAAMYLLALTPDLVESAVCLAGHPGLTNWILSATSTGNYYQHGFRVFVGTADGVKFWLQRDSARGNALAEWIPGVLAAPARGGDRKADAKLVLYCRPNGARGGSAGIEYPMVIDDAVGGDPAAVAILASTLLHEMVHASGLADGPFLDTHGVRGAACADCGLPSRVAAVYRGLLGLAFPEIVSARYKDATFAGECKQ